MSRKLPIVNPLITRPGGKTVKAKRLAAAIPEHSVYVEPFAGGAAVFWNKEPAETEVLGDTEDWIIKFYDDTRKGALDNCKPVVRTRENFQKLSQCNTPCCKFLVNKMSFRGSMKGLQHLELGGTPGAKLLRSMNKYKSRLRKTHLRIGDFENTMRKFDGPDTVHYLDPPYTVLDRTKKLSEDSYAFGSGDLPVEKVAEVASKMQGKVIISYDDSPRAIKAFKDQGLYVYKMPCTRVPKDIHVKAFELVATNFRLPSVLKSR